MQIRQLIFASRYFTHKRTTQPRPTSTVGLGLYEGTSVQYVRSLMCVQCVEIPALGCILVRTSMAVVHFVRLTDVAALPASQLLQLACHSLVFG